MNSMCNSVSTDIMALQIYQNILLIGEGSYIKVYDLSKKIFLSSLKLFLGSTIHCIKKSLIIHEENQAIFLIYGQKSFSLLSLVFKDQNWILDQSKEYYVDDWIIDIAHSADSSSIFIVTAHNYVVQYAISSLLTELVESLGNFTDFMNNKIDDKYIIEKKYCSENSLLYCGRIYGTSLASCIIFSGTAFGKIHIWAPWTVPDSAGRHEPITSLSEIKGAVFSIFYNETNNLIGATSDDRSLQIWKVCFLNKENSMNFGKNFDWQTKWQNCLIIKVFCVFGHSARAWRSEILDDETVLSCGEDSMVCYWSANGVLLRSWIAHRSSSVWCLCYNNGYIFTGGSDGAVRKWNLAIDKKESLICCEVVGNEIIKNKSMNSIKNNHILPNFDNAKHLRSINLIDSTTYTVITNEGVVWVFKESENVWNNVYHHDILKGYIITSVNSDSTLLALGTLEGYIVILDTKLWKCLCQQLVSSSKIQSLFFIGKNQLISCTATGKVSYWIVNSAGDAVCLELKSEHNLPSCRQHWITSAAVFNEENLIVGDPCGNVYLYSLDIKEPKSGLKGLHGKNGVMGIKASKNYILTTGRDGFIRYISVQNNQLSVLCEHKVSRGNWLCGIFKIGQDAFIPIFSGEKLQIWNILARSLVAEVKCGGGHRSWEILIESKRFSSSGSIEEMASEQNDTDITCAFLKDGFPFIWHFTLQNNRDHTIKSPHGGEIQCLVPLFHNRANVLYIFGGEDTLLHFQMLRRENTFHVNEWKSHLSSIRSITIIEPTNGTKSKRNEVKFLTCGGRAQMKIWSATLTLEDIELDRDEIFYSDFFNPLILCKEIATHMLTPESERSWKSRVPAYAPETRYMDCLAFWITEDIALVVLASSDGFIRFFRYAEGEFTMFYIEDCHFCLLRLYLLRSKRGNYILATTTRGALLIWSYEIFCNYLLQDSDIYFDVETDNKDRFDPCFLVQVQKSGLNSISSNSVDQEETYIATGGDDGSIHLLKFTNLETNENKLKIKVEICSKVYRHAAQVSGLAWIGDSMLCSASVDQRIIIWNRYQDRLIPKSVHYCSIPNIQGISLSKPCYRSGNNEEEESQHNSRLFIYGSGIQVFEVAKILNNKNFK